MIQEIMAITLVALAILYVLWRVYKSFSKKADAKKNACFACPSASGCALKELKSEIEKKNKGCSEPERL